MGRFEWNKIFGASVGAVLVVLTVSMVANAVYKSNNEGASAYEVAEKNGTGKKTKPKEIVSLSALLHEFNVEDGKRVFARCSGCHDAKQGGIAKTGPNLWGVVGSKTSSFEAFKYSSALQSKKGEIWDWEKLNAFIKKPSEYAPGTKMTYVGLKKQSDRAKLLLWLNHQSDNPLALPPLSQDAENP
jgi:cytochrome c